MTLVQNGTVHAVRVDDKSLPALENVGPFQLTERVRPAYGGVGIGHMNVTAGTLGTCVYDASAFPGIPQRYHILSNNHVLANSDNATVGDPILQPGRVDGGTFPADVIAKLSRFVPIRFHQAGQPVPLNLVDAAAAEDRRRASRVRTGEEATISIVPARARPPAPGAAARPRRSTRRRRGRRRRRPERRPAGPVRRSGRERTRHGRAASRAASGPARAAARTAREAARPCPGPHGATVEPPPFRRYRRNTVDR